MIVYLGFKAIATDDNGNDYPAPFMISFRKSSNPHQNQVQWIVDDAIKLFHKNHKNGRILQQLQRVQPIL